MVNEASELPEVIVSTVKRAIRRHREEVWRRANPPYLLYGVAGAMGLVLTAFVIGILVTHRGRPGVATATGISTIDRDLTGDVAFRQ